MIEVHRNHSQQNRGKDDTGEAQTQNFILSFPQRESARKTPRLLKYRTTSPTICNY